MLKKKKIKGFQQANWNQQQIHKETWKPLFAGSYAY